MYVYASHLPCLHCRRHSNDSSNHNSPEDRPQVHRWRYFSVEIVADSHARWAGQLTTFYRSPSACCLVRHERTCWCSDSPLSPQGPRAWHDVTHQQWWTTNWNASVKSKTRLQKVLLKLLYIGWQWRNIVPYLCQLVFAAILWLKLLEMFVTLLLHLSEKSNFSYWLRMTNLRHMQTRRQSQVDGVVNNSSTVELVDYTYDGRSNIYIYELHY